MGTYLKKISKLRTRLQKPVLLNTRFCDSGIEMIDCTLFLQMCVHLKLALDVARDVLWDSFWRENLATQQINSTEHVTLARWTSIRGAALGLAVRPLRHHGRLGIQPGPVDGPLCMGRSSICQSVKLSWSLTMGFTIKKKPERKRGTQLREQYRKF